MNTLNGYSKSTLTDSYVLTASGGHRAIGNSDGNIPLNNGTVNTNLRSEYAQFLLGVTIDIEVAGDKETYYPVSIEFCGRKELPNIITIWKNLGSKTAVYTGNHSNGTSSMLYRYECRNNGWDGNQTYFKTLVASYSYAPLVAHTEISAKNYGLLIIWLRGGGTTYKISADSPLKYNATDHTKSDIRICYETTNIGSSGAPVNVSPKTAIENAGIYSSGYFGYGNFSGNATTATTAVNASNVPVTQNTGADVEWPIVWSNQNNTNNAIANLLYKSHGHFSYNPKNQRVTALLFRGSLGDGTMTIKSEMNNEVNFGGTNASGTIYFGYRATDSKSIPSKFVFGSSTGTAEVLASKFTKAGGTSTQFLKADGSVDSTTYATTTQLGNYLPLVGGIMTGHIQLTLGLASIRNTSDMVLLAHSNSSDYSGVTNGTDTVVLGNASYNTLIRSNNTDLLHHKAGTNHVILDADNYNTYTVKKVSGCKTTTNNYVKLGTLPTSTNSTYDSFVVQGSVGGFVSSTKSHIDISVSRRSGITYRGFLQWVNTKDWDLGVNNAGEIFLILPGPYCAWSLSLHTIQGTIDYQTSATPTDTNWTLLSESTSILKFSKEGVVEKADSVGDYSASDLVFHKTYTSLSSLSANTSDWYKVATITDQSGAPCIFVVRTYAHSSAIFTVSKGYGDRGNITLLQYCDSTNADYAYITGARLLPGGSVEIKLCTPKTNSSPYVDISISMYNANNVKPNSTLTLSTSTLTPIDSIMFIDKAIVANKLCGNLDWSYLTSVPTSFAPSDHASSLVTSLSGYSKATSASDLATTDTLNAALGKLEYKSDYAYDWITNVTATDTDTYINKWGEIVGFLDSMKEGTDILDLFVTRKTDQTITGVKIFNSIETVFKSDIYGVRLLGHSKAGWLLLGLTNGDERIHYGRISGINGSYLNGLEFYSSYSNFHGQVTAAKFVTTNGTASQFVKGDGSLDSNSYLIKNNDTHTTAYSRYLNINGTNYAFWSPYSSTVPTIYTHTSLIKNKLSYTDGTNMLFTAISYLPFTYADNGGYPVFLLIAELTNWAAGTNSLYTLVGSIYGDRDGNQANTCAYNIVASCTSYSSGFNVSLYTNLYSDNSAQPYVVEYNGKKYLALKKIGSGTTVYFVGRAVGLSNTYITLNVASNGTLPNGLTILHSPTLANFAINTTKVYDGTSEQNILHTGNYTTYTVKKDGTGASGTWGINITGGATSVIDFGNGTSAIKIGYAGAALTTTTHFAAYGTTSDGTRCIKDISVASVKTVLDVPDNTTAHISAKAFGSDLRYIDKTTDLNTLSYGMYASYDNYDYTNGPKLNFGLMVMRINSGYTGLLAFGYGSSNLMYRSKSWNTDGDSTWKEWLTIAYMTDIPTKVSLLKNDSNYATVSSTLGKSSIGIPNGSIVKVTVPSDSHYLITLRGTQGQRCALLYVSGYGSGGTSTRLTVRIVYSHANFEYYYNEASDSIGGIYVKNAFTGSVQNDIICVTSLNKSDIPTLTTVTTIPTGANKINSAECNLLTVDTADNYFVRNTGSLKNPNALTIFGINYDGSVAQTITANTMISTLSEGTSDVTDNTEILTSYASDNGFADTNAPNTVYKRDAIKVYNYIKGKLDNVYQPKGSYLTSRGYIGNTAVQETSAILALTGISGITFSGGNEYFDQYGNFHFGTAGTTWGVYHNDSSVLLKLTKSTGLVEAKSFKITNGTYNLFLKADGSVDNNTYLTSSSSIPDTSITWSSTGLSGYTGPVSTALCGPLKGNRFAGIKAEAVSIEYSRDAGATWYDYEVAGDYFNSLKRYFFNLFSASFILGKNSDNTTSNDNYRLRVTVDCNIGQVYSELKKAILYVTTNNSNNCTVTVLTSNNNTTYTDRGTYYLRGWSGYNEIPLVGITADPSARGGAYSRYIRFLFSAKYVASSDAYAKGLTIMGIEVFGGVGWTTPNNHIAKYGRPYTFDYLGLTLFYNTVYPAANNSYNLGSPERKWYAIYASSFIGNVTGNATSATKATQDGDGNTISSTYLKKGEGATGVQDYGSTTDRIIKIGYSGTAATTATHFAVYQDDGTKIKDMSVANVKTLLNVPTKLSLLTNDLTYLTRYGEGSKASVRTADRTVALCTGGWSGTETDFYGYGARYGTTLDISGFSTWYHRLAFATTGRIQYWLGINTKTLTHAGNIAFTYDIPTKVSQLTNDNNYISLSGVTKLNSFYSQRPTTPDTQYTDNALRYYLATGLMTTNKPATDAYILQFSWDNTGYNSWLSIPCGSNSNTKMQYRTTVGSSYNRIGSWIDILDSNMLLTATAKTNLGWSSATANKLIPTIGTLAYWTGAYNDTHNSNLQYCVNGEIIGTTNYTTYTVKKDGTGASGTWGINVTGSSGSCTGNAATATCIKKPSSPVTALPTSTTTLTAGITMGIANSATTNKPTNATYGNVIQIGGQGHAQLFMEWSGSSTPTTGKVYYNSKRDIEGTAWGGWVQLIDERDVVTTSKAGLMSAADKTKLDSITGSVTNNLVIKLNNGTAEGTNLFTFNGSAAKTINITPASINALASNGTASAAIRLASKGDNTNANTLCFYSASISSTTLSAMNSWTRPTDGSNNAMVLRMYKTANTGHDIYAASDKDSLWHRNSSNATSKWAKILDSENCYGVYQIMGNLSGWLIGYIKGKNILGITGLPSLNGPAKFPYFDAPKYTIFGELGKTYLITSNPIVVSASGMSYAYLFVGKLTSTRLNLYITGNPVDYIPNSGSYTTELIIWEL